MHSFIVSSSPELSPSPSILEIKSESSIGIDEVRQIQRFLSRKSTSTGHVVLIFNAHTLTLPAQNALLKTLEEPPIGSQIYLITSYPDMLLPTILSRCQVISTSAITPPDDISSSQKLIFQLFASITLSQKLELLDAQEFDRQSALEFLDHLEWGIHQNLQDTSIPKINYDLIISTRKYLKANCSVKLTMDNFIINL